MTLLVLGFGIGQAGADLDAVRVDASGRFVIQGGELLAHAVSYRGEAVDLNL